MFNGFSCGRWRRGETWDAPLKCDTIWVWIGGVSYQNERKNPTLPGVSVVAWPSTCASMTTTAMSIAAMSTAHTPIQSLPTITHHPPNRFDSNSSMPFSRKWTQTKSKQNECLYVAVTVVSFASSILFTPTIILVFLLLVAACTDAHSQFAKTALRMQTPKQQQQQRLCGATVSVSPQHTQTLV